jgi:hypothetical protein
MNSSNTGWNCPLLIHPEIDRVCTGARSGAAGGSAQARWLTNPISKSTNIVNATPKTKTDFTYFIHFLLSVLNDKLSCLDQ